MQPNGDGKSDSSSEKHPKIYPPDHNANRNVQVKKDDRMPGPTDPDWNDVEEYMPSGAGGNSESQLLYVALGVVFGLVALVTVICIIMCMVKQHRQQQTLGKIHMHALTRCWIYYICQGTCPHTYKYTSHFVINKPRHIFNLICTSIDRSFCYEASF